MHEVQHQIIDLLKESRDSLTISQIAERIDKERHTTGKYLESLEAMGVCEHQEKGKSKLWTVSPSPLLSAMMKNDPLSNELKALLEKVDENITLRTPDHDILWSNKKHQEGKKCFEVFANKTCECDHCDLTVAIREGRELKGKCQDHDILATPIKDKDDKVVALMNIRK